MSTIVFAGWKLQPYGGLESTLQELARIADQSGFDVEVVTGRPLPAHGSTVRELARFGYITSAHQSWTQTPGGRLIRAVTIPHSLLTSGSLPSESRLRSVGESRSTPYIQAYWASRPGNDRLEAAGLLHIFGPPTLFAVNAIRAAKRLGVPTVYHAVHEVSAQYAQRPNHRLFSEFCNLCDMIIVKFAAQVADFKEHFGYVGQWAVVGNWAYGVESDLLAIPPAALDSTRTITFGTLSRLDPVKDIPTILEAFAKVVRAGADTRLVIGGSGDGAYEHMLADRTIELGINDRVEFRGYVADRVAFFQSVDAFILASKSEAGATTGVEAMAAGRVVVTTPVGAMAERIDDGTTGRVFEIGDSTALAAALEGIVQKPEQASRMAESARAVYADRFAQGANEAALREVWTSLVR